MKTEVKPTRRKHGAFALMALMTIVIAASTRLKADTGTCGGQMITLPFTDVAAGNTFFCSIAEAFLSGLTNGTSTTTFSPSDPVTRDQVAAFATRTMDQSVKRSSRRAALNQYWTTQGANNLALTTVGMGVRLVQSDGADLWVANINSGSVSRVRASDGKLLETWTGATGAFGVVCAMGKVFVTEHSSLPARLYQIDPTQPAGAVTTISSALNVFAEGIAYDGLRIWTAHTFGGSVSIITLNPTSVTSISTGFSKPTGLIFDGSNIWVTDGSNSSSGKLRRLDSTGAILLSADVGIDPQFPVFDGTNIWVPNFNSNSVTVVRASGALAGTVLATITGSGLNNPRSVAFDGERILVTNENGNSVSLWKASDLTPLGTFSTSTTFFPTIPFGACSDGLSFWITLVGSDKLARF